MIKVENGFLRKKIFGQLSVPQIAHYEGLKFLKLAELEFYESKFYETSYGHPLVHYYQKIINIILN